MDFGKILNKESKQMNLEVSSDFREKCRIHHRLMKKWNKVGNLTSIESPHQQVRRLYLESCIAVKMTNTKHFAWLDIGTGGGFPGFPVKFKKPGIELFLLEANQKKCFFLEEVCRKLELKKVKVLNIRAENICNSINGQIDYISFKAVGNTVDLMLQTSTVLKKKGFFIVFAGEQLNNKIERNDEFEISQTKTIPWLKNCRILKVEKI